ncbi:MAG: alpha-ketoacid dehydrogenase subunit beta [Promethearchaeota archaeon]
MREISFIQAVMEALHEEFQKNKKTIYMSTHIPRALLEFGTSRIRATPVSESAFVGAAIGLAGSGFRPVVNIRNSAFAFVAADQFANQAAKITYMFGGQAKFPIVYRMHIGAGMSMAAQHSISPYPVYMNLPGLKISLPSTPYDAKGLLKTAVRDNNPVLFFEHMALADVKGEVPEEEYTIPFGQAAVKIHGTDVTVVALAKMVHEALAAAEEVKKHGISMEVIDPRTLVPLDIETIHTSVTKTGRLVVVDESCRTCGTAAEIISLVVEKADIFCLLKAPPKRVSGFDIPIPFSPPMERYAVPDKERIVVAVKEILDFQ